MCGLRPEQEAVHLSPPQRQARKSGRAVGERIRCTRMAAVPLCAPPKDGVLAVQVRAGLEGDEELRLVATGPAVGHGQHSSTIVRLPASQRTQMRRTRWLSASASTEICWRRVHVWTRKGGRWWRRWSEAHQLGVELVFKWLAPERLSSSACASRVTALDLKQYVP